jgi:hypothetical protein
MAVLAVRPEIEKEKSKCVDEMLSQELKNMMVLAKQKQKGKKKKSKKKKKGKKAKAKMPKLP